MAGVPESGRGAGGESRAGERRRNHLLRALVDEMLAQVRELQQHAGPWPPDERARAEADLARIMEQVRGAAFRREQR